MSNVIDFLERKGKDAQLRHGSSDDVADALEEAQVDTSLRSAILAGDASGLQSLLKKDTFFSSQMPSEPEEERKEDDEDEDEDIPPQKDKRPVARAQASTTEASA
jgi:hypothetical protein